MRKQQPAAGTRLVHMLVRLLPMKVRSGRSRALRLGGREAGRKGGCNGGCDTLFSQFEA